MYFIFFKSYHQLLIYLINVNASKVKRFTVHFISLIVNGQRTPFLYDTYMLAHDTIRPNTTTRPTREHKKPHWMKDLV